MKKTWIIISIIILALIVLLVYIWFSNDKTPSSQYNASRTVLDENINNTETNNMEQNIEPSETEISSFSTDILSDDKDRLTNIKITCSRINETIIKSGKEFSFCDIVGQPSSDDGYKAADAFGPDGEIIQAIGGRKLSGKYYHL